MEKKNVSLPMLQGFPNTQSQTGDKPMTRLLPLLPFSNGTIFSQLSSLLQLVHQSTNGKGHLYNARCF